MPVQKTDRTTQWSITENDQTWTLARKAEIDVANQNGILENGFSNSTIKVLGDITVTGNFAAVRVNSGDSSVLIGKTSRIDITEGRTGVFVEGVGAGADVVNRGIIDGGFHGVFVGATADVSNYGTIRSATGMYFDGFGSQVENHGAIKGTEAGIVSGADGTRIENARGGLISGTDYGIFFGGTGDAEVVNYGTIRSKDFAIQSLVGDDTLVNRGRIVGDVALGSGADTIDTRKGIVLGEVDGGSDGDTYMISSARIRVTEADNGGGIDEVQSTVSYTLAENVETLRLLGKAGINATGNAGDNTLYGNRGDNRLSGGLGEDFLQGGRGDDVLKGGGDMDVFVFGRTDGSDVIRDFEDGSDRLYIEGVYNEETFGQLDIRESKGDLIVAFDGGNEIRIEDLARENFTFQDIIVLA